jgi:dTDP-4-dehydrorhamnose reductase
MMRLLVTGASGLLGLNLALEARKSHEVIGADRCRLTGLPFDVLCVDLLDPGAAERLLESTHPDELIHCAALADLDACEANKDLARALNARVPGELAALSAQRKVKMVQISSDAVFDGSRSGLYSEEDPPQPLSWYAKTKLLGEQAVLSANPRAIVARVNFYGFSRSGSRSLAEFFINHLIAGEEAPGFTDAVFNPTFVGDLADLLLAMLEQGLSGLYHTASAQAMSKFDFGLALARRFGWDEALVRPESVEHAGLSAQRAHNLGLSVEKLSTALGRPIPDFSTGLDRFYTQFQQGYPQKIRSYPQG